jgi:uncharacterized protein YlxP (DUF503 family)
MLVAALRVDLRIPGCGSLKEKRHVLKTLTNGVRSAFPVAVAETGYQDTWQRAELGIAAVGSEGYHLRKVLHGVERYVERWAEVEIIETDVTLHSPEDR